MPVQSPLKGFPWRDWIQTWYPDRLHTDGKGLLERMLKWLLNDAELSKEQLDEIMHELDAGWLPAGFRPTRLPRGGLGAIKEGHLTSNQIVLLAQCLVAPLSSYLPDAALALAGRAILSCSPPCLVHLVLSLLTLLLEHVSR